MNDELLLPEVAGAQADILYGPVAPALLREEILADLLDASVRLGPLTLVMKGEFIPPGTSWAGCPAALVP
jgi:hypothetical protein